MNWIKVYYECESKLQSTIGEWIVGIVAYTHCGHFYCMCVRCLILFLLGSSPVSVSGASEASEKWKEKHSKTLSVYGDVMVFIFMDMLCPPALVCEYVCRSACVCVTLLPFMGPFYECHIHTHTHCKGDVNLNVFTAFSCRCFRCRLIWCLLFAFQIKIPSRLTVFVKETRDRVKREREAECLQDNYMQTHIRR